MNRSALFFSVFAAFSGAAAVSLGAFGAHLLADILSAKMMQTYQTAVQYQFFHTLALWVVAILCRPYADRQLIIAGSCFALGILLFCGSLYLMVFSGVRWLGAITPLGGIAFIIGWIMLGVSSWHRYRIDSDAS